jgi:hypothetical protein
MDNRVTDVNTHCHLGLDLQSNCKWGDYVSKIDITLRHNLKEQFAVRKDMDVKEHERLSNITFRHKLK